MATKNISITFEAYRKLAGLKRDRESFSDVINRVTGKENLDKFIGIWSDATARKMRNNVDKVRKIRARGDKIRREMISKAF